MNYDPEIVTAKLVALLLGEAALQVIEVARARLARAINRWRRPRS